MEQYNILPLEGHYIFPSPLGGMEQYNILPLEGHYIFPSPLRGEG